VKGEVIMGYSGKRWIQHQIDYDMSDLGKNVADLLGDVFQGIYHLNWTSLKKVKWNDSYCIEFVYYGELTTVDFNNLTILTVLAHDQMIRVSLRGIGPGYIKMQFHQRKSREGSMSERYPTIEDHINIIRKHYGPDGDAV
jgi:hypothetical protein